ncbi:MAG: family 1 extracellular solute-binding protein [Paenibacillus sp.]|jgi:multiple sugar transport system substrate-binding protein|nr:family 1 extracellular solute-binding protein [Paenibacillus sp.]
MMRQTKRMFRTGMLIVSAVSVAALAACSGKETKTADPAVDTSKPAASEPVKLVFYNLAETVLPADQFKLYIEEPIKKKYPHISFDYIQGDTKEKTIEKLVASGVVPDIVTGGPSSLFDFMNVGLTGDMNPLISKYKFDLGRLDEQAVSFFKGYSTKGELISLPVTSDQNVLYYNKDIFDKFGVAYPKDGMTWDDAYELTKKVTRSESGVNYRGIDVQRGYLTYNQLSLPYVDQGTEKPVFNNDGWKSLFAMMQKLYAIPGNEYKNTGQDDFIKNQTLAMFASYNIIMLLKDIPKSFNWDLVTLPTFSQKPNTGLAPFPQHMLVTATSKHKDNAFHVLETMLTDDVQMARGRDAGIAPAITKQSVQEQFMKGVGFAEGKNVGAFFKLQFAAPRKGTPYDKLAITEVSNGLTAVLQGKKDINTALRDAEEQSIKKIEEEKATKK